MQDQSNPCPEATWLIGVDVAKDSLVTAVHGSQAKPVSIGNTPAAIKAWLRSLPPHAAIAMESTGRYQLELASLAHEHEAGHRVYVLNALDVHHYGKALGQRGKTDRLDSQLIAQYLAHHMGRLRQWQPTPQTLMQLRTLLKSRAHLANTHAKLGMALKDVGSLKEQVQALGVHFKKFMAQIDKQVQQLVQADDQLSQGYARLLSIKGVGPQGGALLAAVLARTDFANADALVAFSGLDPRPADSGKKQGLRRLSKRGDPMIRRQMWLCAMAASRCSGFKASYQALRLRGLSATAAYVVIARKILRIAYALWHGQQMFDPNKVFKQPNTA